MGELKDIHVNILITKDRQWPCDSIHATTVEWDLGIHIAEQIHAVFNFMILLYE